MSFMDFSSWPREQEQSFVVYEQRASESSKKALSVGIAVALTWFVLLVGVYFGVQPDHKDMTKGMNMDNLSKRSKKEAPAAAPDPKPAPAPAAAPAAAPEAPAPAAPAEEKK